MKLSILSLGRLLAASALLLVPAALHADTIWSRSGNANPLPIEGTIMGIDAGQIQLQRNNSGSIIGKPLDQVVRIKADGEAALTDAEDAFDQSKWEAAAASYDKALNSTKKDWVKQRALMRLLVAAEKANQFSLSASAYAQLIARDANGGGGDKKPAMPADKTQIAKGIALVERVYNTKQSDLLRGYLGELYIANDELDKANKLLAAVPGGVKDPGLLVMSAKAALKGKNYAAAMDVIDKNRAAFTTPDQQLEALYILAECKGALAGADPAKKQDAALAYMRVVAHFGTGSSPLIIDSLMKTAGLLEQVGQLAEAAGLYKQVSEDNRAKGTALATEAQKKYEQLKNAKAPAK